MPRPGRGQLVGDEPGRTPDVRDGEPGEGGGVVRVVPAEEVPQDGDELGRLAASLGLVEHLRLELGVRELGSTAVGHVL